MGVDGSDSFLLLWVAVHPAEVTENRRDAEIPYAGKVVHVEEFELLAYADRASPLSHLNSSLLPREGY